MGLDVLDDLIESGDLDPVQTVCNRLGACIMEWKASDGISCIPEDHHRN